LRSGTDARRLIFSQPDRAGDPMSDRPDRRQDERLNDKLKDRLAGVLLGSAVGDGVARLHGGGPDPSGAQHRRTVGRIGRLAPVTAYVRRMTSEVTVDRLRRPAPRTLTHRRGPTS